MLHKILKYAGTMVGAAVFSAAVTFSVGMLGAHTRDKESFGDYWTFVMIWAVGQSIVISGINQTIQRFAADNDQRRAELAAFALRGFVMVALLCTIAGVVVGFTFNWHFALAFFGIPPGAFFMWTRSLVRSSFNARREAAMSVAASFCKSVSQLVFLSLTSFEAALIYGEVTGLFLAALISVPFLTASAGMSFIALVRQKTRWSSLREPARFLFPLWVAGDVFTVRNTFGDFWVRGLLGAGGMASMGMMGQVWKVAWAPMDLFGYAALVGLVRAGEGRGELYQRALKFSMLVFPCLGLVVAAGSPLILRVFDVYEKYPEVPGLLWLVVFQVPAAAVEIALSQFSIAEGKTRPFLSAQVASMVVMLALIYPVAQRFGLRGVIAVGLVGQIAQLLGLMIPMYRTHPAQVGLTIAMYLRGMAGVVAGLIPVYFMRESWWSFLSAIPSAVAYIGIVLLLQVVTPAEIAASLKSVLPGARKPAEGGPSSAA